MLDLQHIPGIGQLWRVTADLTADFNLVVPEPLRTGPAPQAGGRFAQRSHIIVLAIHYSYVAGAASVGFDLESIDDAYVPGSSRVFTLWSERSQAAGRVAMQLTDLWIPLSPANLIDTPTNPATLNLNVTGTAPTSGFLSVVGLHTTHTFGDMGYSGSPVVWPST